MKWLAFIVAWFRALWPWYRMKARVQCERRLREDYDDYPHGRAYDYGRKRAESD